jgi:hypothetical protein
MVANVTTNIGPDREKMRLLCGIMEKVHALADFAWPRDARGVSPIAGGRNDTIRACRTPMALAQETRPRPNARAALPAALGRHKGGFVSLRSLRAWVPIWVLLERRRAAAATVEWVGRSYSGFFIPQNMTM